MFKSRHLQLFPVSTVPKYFSVGERKFSIIHARLRNNCSDLKSHLYANHLSNSDICSCGGYIEDVEHFFFICNKYNQHRLKLFRKLHKYHPLGVNVLLYGSQNLNYHENSNISLAVQQFIKATERF